MNHKPFFIALIISLFFHLWAIQIFLVPFDMKEDQLNKEKSAVSTRMIFFHSNSFSQSAGEKIDSYFPGDREIADTILAQDIAIEQRKTLVENVREEIVSNRNDHLPVIEEINEQQEPTEKKEIETTEEEHIAQEKEDTILSREVDIETIQPMLNPEQIGKKSRNNEKVKEIEIKRIKKENNEDIKENMIVSEEKNQINANNQSKQEKIPLDLTQSGFMDSQVIPPKLVSFYPPEYPEHLRKREIEGRVQLRVLIDKEGKAIQVEIDNSSGYQAFDQAALQSVCRWQFESAQFGNKERDSWVLIPVIFKLD